MKTVSFALMVVFSFMFFGCDEGPSGVNIEKQQETVRAPGNQSITMYYTFGDSVGIDAEAENFSIYPGAKMIIFFHTGRGNQVVPVDTISHLPTASSEWLARYPRANYVSRRFMLKVAIGDTVRYLGKRTDGVRQFEWPSDSVAAGFQVISGGPVQSKIVWTGFKRVR